MSPGHLLLLVAIVVGGLLGTFSMLADGIIGGRLLGILGDADLAWTAVALVAGPILGVSGAAIASRPTRSGRALG